MLRIYDLIEFNVFNHYFDFWQWCEYQKHVNSNLLKEKKSQNPGNCCYLAVNKRLKFCKKRIITSWFFCIRNMNVISKIVKSVGHASCGSLCLLTATLLDAGEGVARNKMPFNKDDI